MFQNARAKYAHNQNMLGKLLDNSEYTGKSAYNVCILGKVHIIISMHSNELCPPQMNVAVFTN